MNTKNLTGQATILTGGGSGIGPGIALALAGAGVKVAVCGTPVLIQTMLNPWE